MRAEPSIAVCNSTQKQISTIESIFHSFSFDVAREVSLGPEQNSSYFCYCNCRPIHFICHPLHLETGKKPQTPCTECVAFLFSLFFCANPSLSDFQSFMHFCLVFSYCILMLCVFFYILNSFFLLIFLQ